jgi:cell division protein FtsL
MHLRRAQSSRGLDTTANHARRRRDRGQLASAQRQAASLSEALKQFREEGDMVRRVPSKQRNAVVLGECDRDALKRLGLLLACGLVIACGFVYAGGQHFAALRLGYQTEKLRTVRDELAEEQHRLLLEREAAASPSRLERAALRLGMQPMQAAQIDPLKGFANSSTNQALQSSDRLSESRSGSNRASAQPETKAQLNRKPPR